MFRFIVIFIIALSAHAEYTVTPFISGGVYYRICDGLFQTHEIFCKYDRFGSDTPATFDLGVRVRGTWFDQVDILWHHQSYIDRGNFLGIDLGGPETYVDMVGIRATKEFDIFK